MDVLSYQIFKKGKVFDNEARECFIEFIRSVSVPSA